MTFGIESNFSLIAFCGTYTCQSPSRTTTTPFAKHLVGYRLTEANYSTGDYYHYTYDAVGNRLTQTTQLAVTSYQYDVANRLTSVNGVPYSWDNNGNLLNDGVNTYTYDSANRLISISGGQTATYAYNGLGDRLSQNGVNYTLDLNAGLTQVLNDGTNQYLYGVGKIAQVNTATLVTDYFMTDALGSVRQLTDAQGQVTLANAYEPYGVLAQSAGSAQTSYGFTGEFTDPSGMVYLRARYYAPNHGRFLTRDTWMGDYNSPLSLNRWMYTEGNPVNFTDPSGHIRENQVEAEEALYIVSVLQGFSLNLVVDWGYVEQNSGATVAILPLAPDRLQMYLSLYGSNCGIWEEGEWSIEELREVKKGILDLSFAMNGNYFFNIRGPITIIQEDIDTSGRTFSPLPENGNRWTIKLKPESTITHWTAVHELAHVWDGQSGWQLSKDLVSATGGYTLSEQPYHFAEYCAAYDPHHELPGCNNALYFYGGVPPKTSGIKFNRFEDFAESVTAYVYPNEARAEMQSQLAEYRSQLSDDIYDQYEAHLYYDNFRSTPRGQYIASLLGK